MITLQKVKAAEKQQVVNEVKMTIDAKSVNESYARIASAAFVGQLDPTIDIITDIKTAVSECVTNAIVHGYREIANGKIYIKMQMMSNGVFKISVRDKGVGICDINLARTPCFTTLSDEERSGMGFSIMEAFMDKVQVRSKENVGTTVTMWKKVTTGE